ncbi:MAG: translation initiation factor IF-2 [Methanocellales archaeon]|nr:translation initiation factor IF-2 [Methanocellales archaeon]MDD4898011.1 translation initiation factor IF-2 [Methanocellales archaeon]MDD5446486.1 translation initiation factor IF-2 [Methanocellales archaeon]
MVKKADLRTPIICVLGHIDHGKTSLLDEIRGTSIAEQEKGAITQHIGATEVPLATIQNKCGPIMKGDFKVPGLLFIDTPGHHAFTTLRSRGGSLADLAVLVVDVTEGFQPQTIEALKILRHFKTPFVLAANKIDRIHGWRPHEDKTFILTYENQSEYTKRSLDNLIYRLINQLNEVGFSSDRYDRIRDFQKNVGVIPISAKTGEGIPDLLMILIGLAQRFLEGDLRLHAKGPGRGTVLEVKEDRGLGKTLDVILYDGKLKTGDTIVVGSYGEPIVTRVRALLKPRPLTEIRVEEKFQRVDEIVAAAGIKVVAHSLESALAGSPMRVVEDEALIEKISNDIKSELDEVRIKTDEIGVTLKADTIGSLEALVQELNDAKVPIWRADVGDISKRDIIEAATIRDPYLAVVIGFCVEMLQDAKDEALKSKVQVFQGNVIYRLLEDYTTWVKELQSISERKSLEAIVRAGRFRLMLGCIFRKSKPAIVGVKILGGKIKPGVSVIKESGINVGIIKSIQEHGESRNEAVAGKEVAVSIEGPTVGRQIKEGDILYVDIPKKHARIIEQELCETIPADELETLKEFLEIKRKSDPFWAR